MDWCSNGWRPPGIIHFGGRKPSITFIGVVCSSLISFGPTASSTSAQYNALEVLFNATNGMQWGNSTGWRSPTLGVCEWYGVTCNAEGNVTCVSLASNGLEGDLEQGSGLLGLASLKELDLSNNNLSGSVPLQLGLMPQLETLDLSGNRLTSIPPAWGSGAAALQYLSVQDNYIAGPFPAAWLQVNDSGAYPLVHLSPLSSWFPNLRTLSLRGNAIDMTAYVALQTLAGWRSLQTCDFGANELRGSLNDSFTVYICDHSGPLPHDLGASHIGVEVLDVSGNEGITGAIPETSANLLMLFAEGTSLSGSVLPSFSKAGAVHQIVHNKSVCPSLEAVSGRGILVVALDSSYNDYALCACGDGYQGSRLDCTACSLGWYTSGRGSAGPRTCVKCPANSTTLVTGRWKGSQCVCLPGFYDEQGGMGPSPSCVECPSKSRTLLPGATDLAMCQCEPGYAGDELTGLCQACHTGTYKPSFGNATDLCLPCPAGSYSDEDGATSSSACEPCPIGTHGDHGGAAAGFGCSACPLGTYGVVYGLSSESQCTSCWPGYYSTVLGATNSSACVECPSNYSQPNYGATSPSDCTPCRDRQVSESGSSQCYDEMTEDGTLVGLYLLIAGVFLVNFTLVYVILQKRCRAEMPVSEKVHMKLNKEMKNFIFGQQFWISLFSGVEIVDLMSDLGAYASLLYTAALTGGMKIVYTIVLAFALMASVHGLRTRAIILLDMQEERTSGLSITGNNMLYYEKQYSILQIMTQKRTCRRHVPFDRGNKYLSHHIGVQRHISLNSMRIFIAIFEDVPFLGLNLFLLLQQPKLSKNFVFMMSFLLSLFVLGYKTTLLEKHARLQIRKWNLEARMDTDTMLNKKAARGRRYSWSCQVCQLEHKTPSTTAATNDEHNKKADKPLGDNVPSLGTAIASATDGNTPYIPSEPEGGRDKPMPLASRSADNDAHAACSCGAHDGAPVDQRKGYNDAVLGTTIDADGDQYNRFGTKKISPVKSPPSAWSRGRGPFRSTPGRRNKISPAEERQGIAGEGVPDALLRESRSKNH